LLQSVGDGSNVATRDGQIALDCSIRQIRNKNLYSIATTDFFFPLVNHPYWQGWIGAANTLSDLYAQGVADCDYMLMLLAISREMPVHVQKTCTSLILQGFTDCCKAAGTPVTGGQTVLNPWPIVGGVATSIVSNDEFVRPDGCRVGDVLVLTKPLGTQVAVNVHEWRYKDKEKWSQVLALISVDQVDTLVHTALCSMARLNRNAARGMLLCHAHGATDVTGFGLQGHAQNLCDHAVDEIGMEIDTLPCLANSMEINDHVLDFGLRRGTSAETSGGLLVSITQEDAEAYIAKLAEVDNQAWIIGRVVADSERKAVLCSDLQVLEV